MTGCPALQPFERRGVGGVAGGRLSRLRKAQFFEQHLAQLLRRADRELVPDLIVDASLQRGELPLQLLRHVAQNRRVDGDARVLHACEHGHERHLDLLEQRPQLQLAQLRVEVVAQPVREVGDARRVARRGVDRDVRERDRLAAGAGQLRERRHLDIQPLEDERVEREARLPEEERRDHRIEADAIDRHAVALQHQDVELRFVRCLGDGRVGEDGPHHFGDRLDRELLLAELRCVRDRDVVRLARAAGDRDADEMRPHRQIAIGTNVEREVAGVAQLPGERLQILAIPDDRVGGGRPARLFGGRLARRPCPRSRGGGS